MPRRRLRPAAALALFLLAAPEAVAQSIAFGEPPLPSVHRAAELAEHYQVRLTSAWPQLSSSEGCDNGGGEVIEGTLTRSGAGYAGVLTRRTRLLFCGAHGTAGPACTLELDGTGDVTMRGAVVPDERSPSGRALHVTWVPGADHTARVTGGCGESFRDKVEQMYLTVRHGAVFALPYAGAAPATERLEDYAWVVVVR